MAISCILSITVSKSLLKFGWNFIQRESDEVVSFQGKIRQKMSSFADSFSVIFS